MAQARWSVNGHLVELQPTFAGVRVKVDGQQVGSKIANKAGSYPLAVSGEELILRRKVGLLGVQNELLRNGLAVPGSAERLALTPAPNGSSCAVHGSTPAVIACARCGSFACAACARVDGVRCSACVEKALDEEGRNKAAMAYAAPAAIFAVAGGILGALIGMAAAGGAVAVARTQLPRPVKLGIAAVCYVVAAAVYVAVVAAIRGAQGS